MKTDYKKLRVGKLALTQVQFAQLLGVSSQTVSRWERGKLLPTPYQAAFIEAFRRAVACDATASLNIPEIIAAEGVPQAILVLLEAAFR